MQNGDDDHDALESALQSLELSSWDELPTELRASIDNFWKRPCPLSDKSLLKMLRVANTRGSSDEGTTVATKDFPEDDNVSDSLALGEALDQSTFGVVPGSGPTPGLLKTFYVILASRKTFHSRRNDISPSTPPTERPLTGSTTSMTIKWILECVNLSHYVSLDQAFAVRPGYQEASVLAFRCLALFLSCSDWISSETPYHSFLAAAASHLGDSDKRWSSSESQQAAKDLIEALGSALDLPSSADVVRHLSPQVFAKDVRPFFQVAVSRDKRAGARDPSEFEDRSPWRTQRPDVLATFRWCLVCLKERQVMDDCLGSVLPPVLVLLEDHEVPYKLQGIELLNRVLSISSPSILRRTGLGELLMDPLMTSLTFQESAGLVEGAMNSILQLIPTLADEQSKEFHNKLERVITDGILSGLTYAKSENTGTIQCLFRSIPKVADMQGLLTARYLKPLLDICCEVIPQPYANLASQSEACNAVLALIDTCKPLISRHSGLILTSVAEGWMELSKVGQNGHEAMPGAVDNLETRLRAIVARLRYVCGPSLESDLDVLRRIHSSMYSRLID